MSVTFYDAIVRLSPPEALTLTFTPAGAKEVTETRFAAFDMACGNQIRRVPREHGELLIEGYLCADPEEPLMSMWALAQLAHEHFGIDVEVHAP